MIWRGDRGTLRGEMEMDMLGSFFLLKLSLNVRPAISVSTEGSMWAKSTSGRLNSQMQACKDYGMLMLTRPNLSPMESQPWLQFGKRMQSGMRISPWHVHA